MSTYGWCNKKSQSPVEFILWGLCMSVQNNMAVCSVVDQSMWVEWCSENFRSSLTEMFIPPAPLLKAAPGRSAHYRSALHSDFSLLHSNRSPPARKNCTALYFSLNCCLASKITQQPKPQFPSRNDLFQVTLRCIPRWTHCVSDKKAKLEWDGVVHKTMFQLVKRTLRTPSKTLTLPSRSYSAQAHMLHSGGPTNRTTDWPWILRPHCLFG